MKQKQRKQPKQKQARQRPAPRAKANPPQQQRQSSGLLSTIGGLAGGFLGGPAGAMIGGKAGDLLSQITGFGDYQVNKNDLVNGNSVATFRNTSEGVEISHREFIADITGSVAFANTALDINPGLASTFPWLSTIASQFEEYEMKGLVFEYRPSSGSAVSASSAALGVVVYATDYNVLSPDFVNKQQMESYEFSCSTVPNVGMLHPIECAPQSTFLNNMYVRSGANPSSSDQRMYDIGSFQYATQGMQSAYVVGELWVSYHVLLKKPRMSPNGTSTFAHIVESVPTGGTSAAPFGTSAVIRSSSNLLGIAVGANPATQFQIQIPGNYLISAHWFTGNSNITSAMSLSLGSNITSTNLVLEDSTVGSTTNFTSTKSFGQFVVKVVAGGNGAPNTVTVSGLATMTGGQADVWITPLALSVN